MEELLPRGRPKLAPAPHRARSVREWRWLAAGCCSSGPTSSASPGPAPGPHSQTRRCLWVQHLYRQVGFQGCHLLGDS